MSHFRLLCARIGSPPLCVRVCIFVCFYVCMYVCAYSCMCLHAQKCMYICMYVCVCMYVFVCTYNKCINIYVTCMHACMHVRLTTYMYVMQMISDTIIPAPLRSERTRCKTNVVALCTKLGHSRFHQDGALVV